MQTNNPNETLAYVVGSDNPQLPDLILDLSKDENGTINGTGHIVSKCKDDNDDGSTARQLLLKGNYSVTAESEVIIELNGFEENDPESVAGITLKLDGQWNKGAGSYQYTKAYLHHTQLAVTDETVTRVSFAVMHI